MFKSTPYSLRQRIAVHAAAIGLFLLVAALYCQPALKGKVLVQSDVVYWKAMAHSSYAYKESHGHFPLWTNSLYGGMPAYLVIMEAYNPVSLGLPHTLLMWMLPKPICFFFILSAGFYVLCLVLRINPWIATLGAIAYSYASYSSIAIAVGHETKVMAMGYGPCLLAGILLICRRRYWAGLAMAIFFGSLLLAINHLQITYYYLLAACLMIAAYAIGWVRARDWSQVTTCFALLALAGALSIASNLVTLATTYDYSKATRQGELDMKQQAGTASRPKGYSREYAFQWSYGVRELYTLMIPDFYGGTSNYDFDSSSHFIKKAISQGATKEIPLPELEKDWPLYWGTQPSTSGPVYAGMLSCFLFLFALFYVKGIDRNWIVAAALLGVLIALGRHFMMFNALLFDWLPFYSKFRAPSMALVLPQLFFPLLGVMALQKLFVEGADRRQARRSWMIASSIIVLLLVMAAVFYQFSSYQSARDKTESLAFIRQFTTGDAQVNSLYQAYLLDRKSVFAHDLLRACLIAGFILLVMWACFRKQVSIAYTLALLFFINAADLLPVGKRYLKDARYEEAKNYDKVNFAPTSANLKILEDTTFFRVADEATYTDARTYYYHHDMAGYSPVVLTLMRDLLMVQDSNQQLMNMMNVKYVIRFDSLRNLVVERNHDALGNAWFVKGLHFVHGPVAEMHAMDHFKARDTAVVDENLKPLISEQLMWDSTARIMLVRNDNDSIRYQSDAATPQFAVFSEVYYGRGWTACIDAHPAPIIRVNYALRGLSIPAGRHEIIFRFRPNSYYQTVNIALGASVVAWLCIIFCLVRSVRRRPNTVPVRHSDKKT